MVVRSEPLIDSFSARGIFRAAAALLVLTAAGFTLSLLTPPEVNVSHSQYEMRSCAADCEVSLRTVVRDLQPLSRFLVVGVTIPRPRDNATRRPVMLPFSVADTMAYFIDVRLDGELVVSNASHCRELVWQAGASSASMPIFSLTPVLVGDVDVTVRVEAPFAAFLAAGASDLAPNASFAMPVRVGSPVYSRFELTWRTVFCATALVTLVVYSYGLRCGCGLRDPRGGADSGPDAGGPQPRRRIRPTPEQLWVWTLCALLVAFNNPFFVFQVRWGRPRAAAAV